MASPQVEEGFTKIANELLDAILKHGFSKRQMAVMFAIIRKTYGYNKIEDDMTVTQLADAAGLSRSHASEALKELSDNTGAVLKRDGRHGYLLKINKNYKQWTRTKTGRVPKQDGQRPKTGNIASQNGTHKRQLQNTTPKEKGPAPDEPAPGASAKPAKSPVGIERYMADCRAADVDPIPEGDPVFGYADEAGIPVDYLRLCWREFVQRNRASGKKYKDWRKAFRNCVRGRWYKLWWFDGDGAVHLTSDGQQAVNSQKSGARDAA
jgi:phage replication O-like protein O